MKDCYRLAYKYRDIRRKIAEAQHTIKEFLSICKSPYVSFSGGKDSTVVLALVSEIYKNILVFTQADDMDYPHKKEHCRKVINFLNIPPENFYMINTPNLFEKLGVEKLDPDKIFFEAIAEFEKKVKCDGFFMGLRKEESKGRSFNYIKRGLIYQKKGKQVCTPIATWNGEDVFAYIIQNNISYIDAYDKDSLKPPHKIRSGWFFNEKFIAHGNIGFLKKGFPELFLKLEDKDEKIRSYL